MSSYTTAVFRCHLRIVTGLDPEWVTVDEAAEFADIDMIPFNNRNFNSRVIAAAATILNSKTLTNEVKHAKLKELYNFDGSPYFRIKTVQALPPVEEYDSD